MCMCVLVLSQKKQHNPMCIWQLPLICVLPAREKSISKYIWQLTSFICIEVAQSAGVVPGLSFTIIVIVNFSRSLHFLTHCFGNEVSQTSFFHGKEGVPWLWAQQASGTVVCLCSAAAL